MIADLPGRAAALWEARARSICARLRPAPKAPIRKKPRRLMPSQNRCREPQSVNMATPLLETHFHRHSIDRSLARRGKQRKATRKWPVSLDSAFFLAWLLLLSRLAARAPVW